MPASDDDIPSAAFNRAEHLADALRRVALKMPSGPEMDAIERAIARALEALDRRSVVSALKDEDASHITGRIALVIAQLNALLIASEYLAQMAERLRVDAAALADSIERPDDSEL